MFENIKAYYQNLININEDEWQVLQERLSIVQLQKGELFVKEATTCNHVAFINKGLMRFYHTVDGKEVTGGFLEENQYISEYESFLTRQPANGNIEAFEDSELILLHYNDAQWLYDNYPVFIKFGKKIAEHLYIMISANIASVMLQSPEERYLQFLQKKPTLAKRIPQYMLASYLGITAEHLSRIRKKIATGS